MLFISSQPSVTNNAKYLRQDFLVCQTNSCLFLLKSRTPAGPRRGVRAVCWMLGEQHLLSCSHHGSLHMPHFIKLFKKQRSPKNLKPIKFHPKLDSPRFVSRVIQTLVVTCRSLTPGRISVFYKQMRNAASALGQAIAVACMKTNH